MWRRATSAEIVMSELRVKLPSEVSIEDARFLLAVKLYETDRVSLGKAAEIAELSKPAFMDLLGKLRVPVIAYPAEDLDREARE
jgi:predicted HTH domain antitoxin